MNGSKLGFLLDVKLDLTLLILNLNDNNGP